MTTENLIKELEARGYVYPPCLQWVLEDIDLRLKDMGKGYSDVFVSDKDKRILMECFFERIEEDLIDHINNKLENFLQSEIQDDYEKD